MAYASMADVQARTSQVFTQAELERGQWLLEDAGVMIDAIAPNAGCQAKAVVSVRMVLRAMAESDGLNVPMGATQGSMAAGGYSQSWTISGGGTGELYIGKAERGLLGVGNRIGSYSPTEGLVMRCD